MMFALRGKADVDRAKLLEIVRTDAVTRPGSCTEDDARAFEADMKDAIPEKLIPELVAKLRMFCKHSLFSYPINPVVSSVKF